MKRFIFSLLVGTFVSISAITPACAQQAGASEDLSIGLNKSTNGWLLFDVGDDRRGNAVMQRKSKGIAAAFRIYEGSKLVQEYVLSFPFKGRRADLKATDFALLSHCVAQFNTIVASQSGGFFYLNVSSDDSVGVLCSAQPDITSRR